MACAVQVVRECDVCAREHDVCVGEYNVSGCVTCQAVAAIVHDMVVVETR